MMINKVALNLIKLSIITLFIVINLGSNSYALEIQNFDKSSGINSFLNYQVKQIIKAAAPGNKGLDYFILPESSELDKIPSEPQNPITSAKVELGKALFHETALSINPLNPKHWQQSSCATCHIAQAGFRANIAQGLGTGGLGWNQFRHRDPEISPVQIDKQNVLVPSVLNSAYQTVQMWDGRIGVAGPNIKEAIIKNNDVNRHQLQGLETQPIDGIAFHRLGTAAIAQIPEYQKMFAAAFPDRPYVSAEQEDNKRTAFAIAAYERTLLANKAPFQKWLKGDENAMSAKEVRGAKVFFSSTCVQCHVGPSLAVSDFRAVGFADHPADFGGLNLGRGAITKRTSDDFKFKVPQLYNLADSSPYGHGASFKTIREIVEYFNQAEPQKQEAKYSGSLSVWFKPLHLTVDQVDDITSFLEVGLRDPNLTRYLPKIIPSGLCFPNNDPESRKQLNCDMNLSH
ncbi:cytochrome-c peroxidase [Cylindrospermum stagnale]|nr:cytochrome c peroxidase [Cylindrospermum stagnale]